MANFTPTGVTFVAQGLNQYLGNLGKADKAQKFVGASATGLALGLTNLAANGFKAVIREGSAFEKEMSKVGALTGATGKNFAGLEQVARGLGATTKFTAIEAAEGMSFLAQAGFETNEIISAMPGTLNLAAAAGVGLGQSADIVSNILTGFGAAADSTGQFVDVLTNTFTSSNTNLQQLGQAMKNVAPVAASMGIGVEQVAAAIGKMGDAGIQGGMAGTQLRNAILNLASPTAAAKNTIEKLGIEIFDASGQMLSLPQIIGNVNQSLAGLSQEQQIVALKTLVGKRSLAGFQVLLNEGQFSLEDYTKSLGKSGTAAEIAAQQIDNLAGDTAILQSALTDLGLSLFDVFGPTLRQSAQAVTEGLQAWSFAIQSATQTVPALNAVIDENTGKLLTNAQTLGEIDTALASGIGNFTNTQTAIANTTGSFDEYNAELLRLLQINAKAGGSNQLLLNSLKLSEQEYKKLKGAVEKEAAAQNKANQIQARSAEALRMGGLAASFATIELEGEAKALEGLSEKLLIAADKGTFFLSSQERIQVILARNTAGIEAQAARMAGLAASFGVEADFTRITPKDLFAAEAAEQEAIEAKIKLDTDDLESAIKSELENIKSAISQVSGLTFSEILPPEETFRVDEWARRMAAVAQDGKNEWVDEILTQFGGQEFIRPFEEAVAQGDPAAIEAAAQAIINGQSLFDLMDIEGAVTQVEGLIAEQNLQQRINDAILAAITEGGGELPVEGGIGGGPLLNAIGLGEGADPGPAITNAVTGLGIPELINQALVGGEEGGENPLLTLLGLGEDGVFATTIATLVAETVPSIGTAFATLFENAKIGFDEVLLSTQTWDTALINMTTVTIVSLQTSITTMASTTVGAFKNIDTSIALTDKNLKKLRDTIGKEIVEALGKATDATIEWVKALERASFLRDKLRPTAGGDAGAASGVGFAAGTGPLGFQVPNGFPNDSFPINVQSGERVLVAPRGRSIESITGSGSKSLIVEVHATINNDMDEMVLVEKIKRVAAEGFIND